MLFESCLMFICSQGDERCQEELIKPIDRLAGFRRELINNNPMFPSSHVPDCGLLHHTEIGGPARHIIISHHQTGIRSVPAFEGGPVCRLGDPCKSGQMQVN